MFVCVCFILVICVFVCMGLCRLLDSRNNIVMELWNEFMCVSGQVEMCLFFVCSDVVLSRTVLYCLPKICSWYSVFVPVCMHLCLYELQWTSNDTVEAGYIDAVFLHDFCNGSAICSSVTLVWLECIATFFYFSRFFLCIPNIVTKEEKFVVNHCKVTCN